MARLAVILVACILVAVVHADIYMHNMRGSNNRLNENNQARQSANRVFDSQNNNRGGYNVGDSNASGTGDGQGIMEYYESSKLTIEWTNQHGSNNPKMNSNFVIQYMCNDAYNGHLYDPTANNGVRDGSTTGRINANNPGNQANGKHEPVAMYNDCDARERNKGLFIADQDLNGDTAIYTRQNTNGAESGLECPEERDYYPYWHPTPWIDIAILIDEDKMDWACGTKDEEGYYAKNSENVVGKNYCTDNQYNNEDACTTNGGTWSTSDSFSQVFGSTVVKGAPDCVAMPWSRDNHLGNTKGGKPLSYTWDVPAPMGTDQNCVLRVRYNISTKDYDGWTTDYTSNEDDETDIKESPIQDNPNVNIGDMDHVANVALAINTDQYGRTFQDRSHVFKIMPKPTNDANGNAIPADSVIYNLNVRGRRGNIVETYPSIEYDFTPNDLEMKANDIVHIQWTGSLSTPNGAGQGAASTDKSNLICIEDTAKNIPATIGNEACDLFATVATRACMATSGTYCGSQTNAPGEDLNDAPAYFNGGLQKIGPAAGAVVGKTYGFLGTRNNNFSNRAQKGKITIVE